MRISDWSSDVCSSDVGNKGILGADRLADAVGQYRAFVDAARNPVVERARLADMPAQEIEVALAQVAAGSDAETLHLRRRSRAAAVEFADRQATGRAWWRGRVCRYGENSGVAV